MTRLVLFAVVWLACGLGAAGLWVQCFSRAIYPNRDAPRCWAVAGAAFLGGPTFLLAGAMDARNEWASWTLDCGQVDFSITVTNFEITVPREQISDGRFFCLTCGKDQR